MGWRQQPRRLAGRAGVRRGADLLSREPIACKWAGYGGATRPVLPSRGKRSGKLRHAHESLGGRFGERPT